MRSDRSNLWSLRREQCTTAGLLAALGDDRLAQSAAQLGDQEPTNMMHSCKFCTFGDGTGDAVFDHEIHAILPPVLIAIPAKYEHGFRFSKDMDGMVITMAASRFGALGRSLVDVEISKWFSTATSGSA